MKRILTAAAIITVCAALRAGFWTHNAIPDTELIKIQTSNISVELVAAPAATGSIPQVPTDDAPTVTVDIGSTAPEYIVLPPEEKPIPEELAIQAETPETIPLTAAISAAAPQGSDPYRKDVYPNNVYSEELSYNSNGELIGKTTICPASGWWSGAARASVQRTTACTSLA